MLFFGKSYFLLYFATVSETLIEQHITSKFPRLYYVWWIFKLMIWEESANEQSNHLSNFLLHVEQVVIHTNNS